MSSLHRLKGGAPDIGRKSVVVRYEGREHSVSWFPGTSDEAISRAIDNALSLPRGTPAVIRDPEDGSALAVSDSLPDGLMLDATPAVSVPAMGALTALGGGRGGGVDSGADQAEDGFHGSGEIVKGMTGNGGGGGNGNVPVSKGADNGLGITIRGGNDRNGGSGAAQEFRGELLKFERVNAHLANERTWLAWVRTALSVLGVALSLLSLAAEMGTLSMDTLALALGVTFVACTIFTYMTGWLRYTRVKEVLSWTGSQVKGSFGRFGLQYFTHFLGIALVLTIPIYMIGGINVVADA